MEANLSLPFIRAALESTVDDPRLLEPPTRETVEQQREFGQLVPCPELDGSTPNGHLAPDGSLRVLVGPKRAAALMEQPLAGGTLAAWLKVSRGAEGRGWDCTMVLVPNQSPVFAAFDCSLRGAEKPKRLLREVFAPVDGERPRVTAPYRIPAVRGIGQALLKPLPGGALAFEAMPFGGIAELLDGLVFVPAMRPAWVNRGGVIATSDGPAGTKILSRLEQLSDPVLSQLADLDRRGDGPITRIEVGGQQWWGGRSGTTGSPHRAATPDCFGYPGP